MSSSDTFKQSIIEKFFSQFPKLANKEIIALTKAYKEIFKSENLTENLKNLKSELKKNNLVKDVVEFLEKDKKRPICTPFSK